MDDNPEQLRKCTRCGWKPITEFSINPKSGKFYVSCDKCEAYFRQYYLNNQVKKKAQVQRNKGNMWIRKVRASWPENIKKWSDDFDNNIWPYHPKNVNRIERKVCRKNAS